jgi:hypothetical protein
MYNFRKAGNGMTDFRIYVTLEIWKELEKTKKMSPI